MNIRNVFLVYIWACVIAAAQAALQNCPMSAIRAIILRASMASHDPAVQMQDIYGGTWGVLIISDPNIISKDVHWTIPDHNNADGSPAFCLTVVNRWQYNIFKTGSNDTPDRVTVEDIVNKIRQTDHKARPERFTVPEFDQKVAQAIEMDRRRKRKNLQRVGISRS